MPSKHSWYDVEEYVPAALNPTRESQPMVTRQHTQYEMADASRSLQVKTVLSIEHEAAPTPIITEDDLPQLMEVNVYLHYYWKVTDLLELMQVNEDSDNEDSDSGCDDSGHDNDKDCELEAAGLGEIHVPEAMRSKHVCKTHTVSHTLEYPAVVYLPST